MGFSRTKNPWSCSSPQKPSKSDWPPKTKMFPYRRLVLGKTWRLPFLLRHVCSLFREHIHHTFTRFLGGGYGVTTPISGRKSIISFVGLFHPYIISKVYVISPRLIVLDFGGLLSDRNTWTRCSNRTPLPRCLAPRDISDCECSKRGLRRPERQDLRFRMFSCSAMEDGLISESGLECKVFFDVQNDFPNHSVHQHKNLVGLVKSKKWWFGQMVLKYVFYIYS